MSLMGIQAMMYRWRRLMEKSGADNEFDYYHTPEVLLWPRPCWCEWSNLRNRLLGRAPLPSIACACAGPVNFNVPGYEGRWGEGDENRMRRFCEGLTA